MKKVLNYIFKDWSVFDYVILSIFVVFIIVFLAISQFPIYPAICGLLILFSTIFARKKTVLGYAVTLATIAYYSWLLYSYNFFGDFLLSLVLVAPMVIYMCVNLFIKRQSREKTFKKIDFIILPCLIIFMAYPLYLLFVQWGANYCVFQTINFLLAFVIIYLKLQNIDWAKYLFIIVTALQLTLFILMVVDLEVSISTVAFGLLFSLLVQIVYFCKDAKKHKHKIEPHSATSKS